RRAKVVSLIAMAVSLSVIVFYQGRWCRELTAYFAYDELQRLREFVAKLPPGTMIASDAYANLHYDGDPRSPSNEPQLKQKIDWQFTVGQLGTIANARREGFQYIAVAEPNFERYLSPRTIGYGGFQSQFQQIRSFYQELFAHAELVWASHPRYPT